MVNIIPMKVGHFPAVIINRCNGTRGFVGHGFHVEVQPAGGSVDSGNESSCFRTGGQETGFQWGEGFNRKSDSHLASKFADFTNDFNCPCKGIFVNNSMFEVALLGAAQNHNRSAHLCGQSGKLFEVVTCCSPHSFIGMSYM